MDEDAAVALRARCRWVLFVVYRRSWRRYRRWSCSTAKWRRRTAIETRSLRCLMLFFTSMVSTATENQLQRTTKSTITTVSVLTIVVANTHYHFVVFYFKTTACRFIWSCRTNSSYVLASWHKRRQVQGSLLCFACCMSACGCLWMFAWCSCRERVIFLCCNLFCNFIQMMRVQNASVRNHDLETVVVGLVIICSVALFQTTWWVVARNELSASVKPQPQDHDCDDYGIVKPIEDTPIFDYVNKGFFWVHVEVSYSVLWIVFLIGRPLSVFGL